jgi:hypothetical protein
MPSVRQPTPEQTAIRDELVAFFWLFWIAIGLYPVATNISPASVSRPASLSISATCLSSMASFPQGNRGVE